MPIALSQQYLKECFSYDPTTGVLSWKHRPRSHFSTAKGWKRANAHAGDPVGTLTPQGRLMVNIRGKGYFVHRLIWKLVYGRDPFGQIDHINRDPLDNRLRNLRIVTPSENSRNTRHNHYKHPIRMLADECFV